MLLDDKDCYSTHCGIVGYALGAKSAVYDFVSLYLEHNAASPTETSTQWRPARREFLIDIVSATVRCVSFVADRTRTLDVDRL